MKFEKRLLNENEMMSFGERLSHIIQPKALIYLEGELGAGKTTLTRGFLRGCGYLDAVKSPTYTLVEPYDLGEKFVYHFDLYRLGHPEELEMIGIFDYLNDDAICIIEWPERGKGILPVSDLTLTLDIQTQGRVVKACAKTDKGQKILECLLND